MAVRVDGAEIVLTGMVGENYWEDGFTAGEVIAALAMVGRDTAITVRLNSGGGYATEGAAIHSALVSHPGKVTLIVEGVAASAASLIAMAGDEVVMALGAVMMVHDPASGTWGTAEDHRRSLDMLTAMGTSFAGIYAAKTGGAVEDMRNLMRAETWMTADEAVAAKFADIALSAANENTPAEPTAFAYGVYAKAPATMRALADANGWKPRAVSMAAPPAANRQTKDVSMTDKTPPAAGDTAAAKAEMKTRIKMILTSEEAQGRAEMAAHLAYETEHSADDAIALMKVAPKASTEATESFVERKTRMAGDGLGAPSERPQQPKASWKAVTTKMNARRA